ncbi:Nucleotide-binding alpha-beta plait [Penicillium cataractarum]|uniref:Nucleotide-binding alpha-beta plait n=1 Tax=Penicillium cataractarum TaxID=2100454 RepID=A0A9W9V4L0_9EURO|nr:Nucleotide-binding alpha-beta plait [Penicillium cataractarum]KAJ5368502.1 Nucleotide-binding alpha-beta plait [Penicillium cataractarum]
MSGASTVHVSGISHSTSEKEVRDFFSFCGKITNLSITPVSSEADAPQSASVTFEKEAAAKTALLLDQTQLGTSSVHVEAAQSIDTLAGASATSASTEKEDEHDIAQEDKPRSRIFAEYLAHGYVVSDGAIQKAIALDQKHGFSTKFTSALSNFDKKYNATERARGIDNSYKISDKAATGWRGLHSYFEKALEHPSGQKLRDFYVQTDKQVRDIHNEARRLADLKQGKGGETEGVAPVASEAAGVAPATAPVSEPAGTAAPAEPKA